MCKRYGSIIKQVVISASDSVRLF